MKSENRLNIPVLLFAILFIGSVYSTGTIATILLQIGLFELFLENERVPFVKLIVLFFQILFLATYFKKISDKKLTKNRLTNLLVLCLVSFLVVFVLKYFNVSAKPMLCGNTFFEENWYESIYGGYNRNESIVNTIQTLVVLVATVFYSFFRIREMPDNNSRE